MLSLSLSMPLPATSIFLYSLPLLLAAHLLNVRRQRYAIRAELEALFGGRYALSEADEQRGLKRMTESGLRGVRDAQYIFRKLGAYEMPFVSLKSLEIALFRTYGVPSISKILLRTGQFVAKDKASRRYVDTSLLVASFFTYPLPALDLEVNDVPRPGEEELYVLDDPRASIALARVNFLHKRADGIHRPKGAGISNDDLLYTLSTFILEPIRFYQMMGYRVATPLEEEALYAVFYHIGRCMGIRSIPPSRSSFAAWSEAYEAQHLIYAPQNHTVATETVHLLLHHVPRFLRPPLFYVVASLLDERLRLAIGFDAPPGWLVCGMHAAMKAFAFFQRHFCLPRKHACGLAPSGNDNVLHGEMGMCPVSGAKEGGGTCPASGKGEKARMYPNWAENDPHYMPPAPPLSLRWAYEHLFVSKEKRYGAKKWAGEGRGYRLEECGPRGLERIGHAEVLREATRLHGKPITGIWAFEAPEGNTSVAEKEHKSA